MKWTNPKVYSHTNVAIVGSSSNVNKFDVGYLNRGCARIPENNKISTVGIMMVYACVEPGIVLSLYGFSVNEGAVITHYL